MVGTLYVVATPIGNLEDITLRGLKVLGQVPLVVAEDTRTIRKLMTYYGIKARVLSYYEENRASRIPVIMAALEVGDVALVSEAGVPGVSDPGRELVAEACRLGHVVVPVPGPSAVTAALAVSGLPGAQFRFLGFLPRQSSPRRQLLEAVSRSAETLVVFEAPHRLRASLRDMEEVLGDRNLVVCRELTKLHEEIYRGTVAGAREHFQEPRGEFTLVVQGGVVERPELDRIAVVGELKTLKAQGLKARDAVAQVSQRWGIPRRQAYNLWLELGQGRAH